MRVKAEGFQERERPPASAKQKFKSSKLSLYHYSKNPFPPSTLASFLNRVLSHHEHYNTWRSSYWNQGLALIRLGVHKTNYTFTKKTNMAPLHYYIQISVYCTTLIPVEKKIQSIALSRYSTSFIKTRR